MIRLVALLLVLIAPGLAYAQSSSLNPPAIISATTAATASKLVTGQHMLLGFHVTTPTPGYVLAFDSASIPADGAVTPLGCFSMPPPVAPGLSATLSMAAVTPLAIQAQQGIALVFSSTGCFTKTGVATAFFSVLYQ